MLQELQSSEGHVTQIIGMCGDVVITEFHQYGSASNIQHVLKSVDVQSNHAQIKFKLCMNYVRILNFLHNGPLNRTYVMCDSNDLDKTLQQYLIADDLRLILNDVDSLAVIDRNQNKGIKCGHKELSGEFVAPEQLWPFDNDEFFDEEMPAYDEKADIWKIPNVCNYFLGHDSYVPTLKLQLFDIHMKCKQIRASERPTAADVLEVYHSISTEYFGENFD